MATMRAFSRPLHRYPNTFLLVGVTMTLAAALAGGPGTDSHGGGAPADTTGGHGTPHQPGAITPDAALGKLIEGNQRFASGQARHPNCDAARRKDCVDNGQHPFATILTCSDSRLAAERIFDQGVGDVFIVRVAGNVADTDQLGTIEYGVGHLHTPLLVIMGHTECGAVKAVAGGAKLDGCLPKLVDNIQPAVETVRHRDPKLTGDAFLAAAVEANVWHSLADTIIRSSEVRTLLRDGRLQAVGAIYDLERGVVRWLGAHPEQDALLKSTGESTADHLTAQHEHPQPNTPSAAGGTPADTHADAGPPTVVAGAVHTRQQTAAPDTLTTDHSASQVDGPPTPTAGAALQALRDGNARFVSGRCSNPRADRGWLAQTARGQHPFATVLACSDSRIPVERIFDQGIGDLFVVRVAGNVSDTDEVASIEYAVGHLHTPLLIVLGHTACGAVTAVANHVEVHGHIPALVDNIAPAVARVRAWDAKLSGSPLVAAAIRANVQQSIQDILTRSPIVRERLAAGELMIVPGVYDLAAGTVDWIDDPTRSPARDATTPSNPNPEASHDVGGQKPH